MNSAINFISNNEVTTIGISVFNSKLKEFEDYKGFIEDKGFVSKNAENYDRSLPGKEASWEIFDGLGYTGKTAIALPRQASSQTNISKITEKSPVLEYDFHTFNFGEAIVNVQAIPAHAFYKNRGVGCAISIDDAEPVIIDFQTFGRSDAWKQNASVKSAKQIVNRQESIP